MTKQEFITQLEKQLTRLPQTEKEHVLNYYHETIEDHIEDGMSEVEAVQSLDSIEVIVKQIYAEREIPASPLPQRKSHRGWRITALIFLSPFWLALLATAIILYLTLWALIAALTCMMLAFLLFVLVGIWQLLPIFNANMASGFVLLGTILLSLGLIPLCWQGLRASVTWTMQHTGLWLTKAKQYAIKAVN